MSDSRKNNHAQYREIITRVVCGNTQKFFNIIDFIELPPNRRPAQILGGTVTGFELDEKAAKIEVINGQGPGVSISGHFEVHVWYAFDNRKSTDVTKKRVTFKKIIQETRFNSDDTRPVDARINLVKEPECTKITIEDNKIKVSVEMGVSTEVIGETRIVVRTYPN